MFPLSDGQAPVELFRRLRRAPSASSVPGSLPILSFGDYTTAVVATVALNPSNQEYTTAPSRAHPAGEILSGTARRFATLESLGARSREELTDEQCEEALAWMRGYFRRGERIYRYFGHLQRFLEGVGHDLTRGTAVHLDLVQESTFPVWRRLPFHERDALLAVDLGFLTWQLNWLPLEAVFCNGRTASEHVSHALGVTVHDEGIEQATGKLKWWVGTGVAHGKTLTVAGWNIPLNQATGLDSEGERRFGAELARRVASTTDSLDAPELRAGR
ncbi:MAG: hypothetical protein M3Z65_00700 [Chloroflexota bacterium]|nr:hypothetical protein [Chloroflexota bacterium]